MKETEIVDNTVLLIEKCDIQFTQLNQIYTHTHTHTHTHTQKSPNRLSIKC